MRRLSDVLSSLYVYHCVFLRHSWNDGARQVHGSSSGEGAGTDWQDTGAIAVRWGQDRGKQACTINSQSPCSSHVVVTKWCIDRRRYADILTSKSTTRLFFVGVSINCFDWAMAVVVTVTSLTWLVMSSIARHHTCTVCTCTCHMWYGCISEGTYARI